MSYGPAQVFECAIASGASTSSSLDLGHRPFRQTALRYVTMSTGAAVTVWGSTDNSTFFKVHERVNTAPVQYQELTVATAVSGGNWAVFQTPPFRYLQFTTSAVVSGGVSFTIVCQG
jgi:putative intracellular protease/amidase